MLKILVFHSLSFGEPLQLLKSSLPQAKAREICGKKKKKKKKKAVGDDPLHSSRVFSPKPFGFD